MSQSSILLSFKSVSHALGVQEFPEADTVSPHNSLSRIRKAIHSDEEAIVCGDSPSMSSNQFDIDFAELVLAKLESLLSLRRELEGNEVLAAANALNYLGSTLAQQFLMEKDELNGSALRQPYYLEAVDSNSFKN